MSGFPPCCLLLCLYSHAVGGRVAYGKTREFLYFLYGSAHIGVDVLCGSLVWDKFVEELVE